MRRTILLFTSGIFFTALLCAAVSVYLFHDVDTELIGHWNQAFAGLCSESLLFAAFIGLGVGLFSFLGRQLLHLKGYSPRAKLALFLGIGVTLVQYPWDFAGRKAFPKHADSSLALYMVLAIVLCSVIVIHDNLRQMRLRQFAATSSDT